MLAYAVCLLAAGHAAAPLFYPGAIMRDTDGNIIRAHQPHVYSENGSFYLIGSAHVGESDGASRNPLSNRGSPLEVTGGLRRPLIRRRADAIHQSPLGAVACCPPAVLLT